MHQVGIIGGGLAGLALAIDLRQRGIGVLLFEKKKYPFHRVCGEYISLESWNYIKRLGLHLKPFNLPVINRVGISAPNGTFIKRPLKLGGFGISRYLLDYLLFQKAVESGVKVVQECNVLSFSQHPRHWEINTNRGKYTSHVLIGAFGKRSNIDTQMKRSYLQQSRYTPYIGVKYHIKYPFPNDAIQLHNFKDGYCGISQIEDERCCLCYLTTADNLKASGSISQMESEILAQNPYLKEIFAHKKDLYEKPLSISQVNFSQKKAIEHGIPMIGDAAGLIAPLSGNGMSIAFRSAFLIAPIIDLFLKNEIDYPAVLESYQKVWKKHFKWRLQMGRNLQHLFGHPIGTNIVLSILKPLPALTDVLIRQTHGKPF